jgi:hypothetical protein
MSNPGKTMSCLRRRCNRVGDYREDRNGQLEGAGQLMKIAYYEEDDTPFIEFSKDAIVADESLS